MGPELLEIQPHELKFTFELKKQSTCSVHLVNNLDQFVAFKVKTTSPKRYCVRPNVGVVPPRSTCDFTVTMQAQRAAPPDMQSKDKFLVQSTIVPFGTTEEEITPSMFAKDNGKYIEENKLRVVLISPPHSPVLLPINGTPKQEPAYEAPVLKDQVLSGEENLLPPNTVANDMEDLKPAKDVQELKVAKDVQESKLAKDVQELKVAKDVQELKVAKDVQESKLAKYVQELKLAEDVQDLKLAKDVQELKLADDVQELKQAEDVQDLKLAKNVQDSKLAKDEEELRLAKDVEKLQLTKDIEKLKSNINELESKLSEAESTITRLRVERSTIIGEKQTLSQELAMLTMKNGVRKVQVGFPFLFVCMVVLVSLVLGYQLHS
ncbi:MSP domain [Macleaya cordata]|uniref:MSP domain n=1 Tax=Macleaya cordata TaxID=56857 RepID=A0A200Q1M3_MACCD|nr:MSP domain [Macleaya cordata]